MIKSITFLLLTWLVPFGATFAVMIYLLAITSILSYENAPFWKLVSLFPLLATYFAGFYCIKNNRKNLFLTILYIIPSFIVTYIYIGFTK